jgi:hypothetical protein
LARRGRQHGHFIKIDQHVPNHHIIFDGNGNGGDDADVYGALYGYPKRTLIKSAYLRAGATHPRRVI